MIPIMTITPEDLYTLDPLELDTYLRNEVQLEFSDKLTDENKMFKISELLITASSYICYFSEMEVLSKNIKRKKKREGCTQHEFEDILGCEEIFAVYKKISERYYEQISKQMTLKRLELEEMKIQDR